MSNPLLDFQIKENLPMLTSKQINTLQKSILGYSFPAIYYDFASHVERNAGNMRNLEAIILKMLISHNQQQVRYGLANIIYWGNANAGYQKNRTCKFLMNVTAAQLRTFQSIVVSKKMLSLRAIKKIGMPQYSGISFISKILMFLNPNQYCVLDLRIADLANQSGTKAIHNLKINKTQLPVTTRNCKIYDQWCDECQKISNQYYSGKYRAVDIERGFFDLIQHGGLSDAQMIYNAA